MADKIISQIQTSSSSSSGDLYEIAAKYDKSGNPIESTYAKKSEIPSGSVTTTGTMTSGHVVISNGGSVIKDSGYTISKSVPSDAVFTDHITTATTSGSGNAVTAVTASNGALTITKGATFLTSHQDISGKESSSNKVSSWSSPTTDTHYPSEKLVKTALDAKSTVAGSSTNGNIKINGTETTVYTHPTYDGYASGLYKITTNLQGHVSAATAVTKSDITNLGIPGSDTNTTYSFAEGSTNGAFSVTPSGGSAQSVRIHNVGTVTQVSAGTGLKITGTASTTPKVEIDDSIVFVMDCGSSTTNI